MKENLHKIAHAIGWNSQYAEISESGEISLGCNGCTLNCVIPLAITESLVH